MGFFKKAKKKVKKVAKKVKSVAPRVVAGVATGGTTEVLRATGIGGDLPQLAESVLTPTSGQDLGTITGAISDPGGTLARSLTGTPQPSEQGGSPVAGNFLGGLAGILNTTSGLGGNIGTLSQIGSGFLSGFLPAQGPVAGRPIMSGPGVATPTMAVAPAITGAARAVTGLIAPILEKLSFNLGRNVSLRAAMIIIRRLGKVISSPTAIAVALGLTIGELEQILVANSVQGSQGRRMNPGNVKALRRAHRRIKSFHKLCGDNDTLRAPRRRRAATPKTVTICK